MHLWLPETTSLFMRQRPLVHPTIEGRAANGRIRIEMLIQDYGEVRIAIVGRFLRKSSGDGRARGQGHWAREVDVQSSSMKGRQCDVGHL
jgi:hypothetical protein